MPSRRDALLAGGSLFASTLLADFVHAQAQEGFAALRKNVGKRACYKCDDRGQVQSVLGGGQIDKPTFPGMPDVGWIQQGYTICPDCLGESKEFRTACSINKDGVLPITKLAKKKIEKHKAAGTLKDIQDKVKAEKEIATAVKLFAAKGKRSGGTFLGHLIAHYRTATLTRGIIRALVLRHGPRAATNAANTVQSSTKIVDKANLLTQQDILKFAAAMLDIKYREPCGFPPSFNELPTFKTGSVPDGFILQLLG
jgi:hypothetical protein